MLAIHLYEAKQKMSNQKYTVCQLEFLQIERKCGNLEGTDKNTFTFNSYIMADTKLLDIHTQLAGVDENKDKLELSDLRGASELLRHKAIQDLRSMREDLYVKLLKNPKDKDLNDQKKALASFVSELLRLDSEYQSRKDSTIEQTSAVVDTIKELFREAKNTEIRLIELKSDVEKNAVNRWFKRVSIYNKDEERINQGSFEKLLTNHDATELIEGLRKIDDIEERKKYLNRN